MCLYTPSIQLYSITIPSLYSINHNRMHRTDSFSGKYAILVRIHMCYIPSPYICSQVSLAHEQRKTHHPKGA